MTSPLYTQGNSEEWSDLPDRSVPEGHAFDLHHTASARQSQTQDRSGIHGRGGGGVSLTLVTSHGRNLVIESAHGPALWCNPSACDSSPLTFLKNV